MPHLLDRYSFEQGRQWTETLVVMMKMKVHVLVHSLKLVSDCLVQQITTQLPIHCFPPFPAVLRFWAAWPASP